MASQMGGGGGSSSNKGKPAVNWSGNGASSYDARGKPGWRLTPSKADDPIGFSVLGPGSTTTTTTDDDTSTTTTPPGGGGGGGITKSDDSKQVAALRRMIERDFAVARDIKLDNLSRSLKTAKDLLLSNYATRAGTLKGSREDNEKAISDTSFENYANRARERMDILAEAGTLGLGESDTLKSQLMAVRNWSANQGDVDRSYFDTVRSIDSAVVGLNADTRTSLVNAQTQSYNDQAQVWANFHEQQADANTQLGNIESNKYSKQFNAGSDAFTKAAEAAGGAFKNPDMPSEVKDWTGDSQPLGGRLTNTDAEAAVTNLAQKGPTGAKQRKW